MCLGKSGYLWNMATKTSTVSHLPDPRTTPTVDQVGIEERVARIQARSIKKETKVQGMEARPEHDRPDHLGRCRYA